MHTDALNLRELLGPEEIAELRQATQSSLDSPGAFIPVPASAYRKLEDVVEQRFHAVLEAVREAERMPSVEAVKLRIR